MISNIKLKLKKNYYPFDFARGGVTVFTSPYLSAGAPQ